jgi:hypothetical protein
MGSLNCLISPPTPITSLSISPIAASVDQSALQAIEAISGKYQAAGKHLQLTHLSRDCHQLLEQSRAFDHRQ